MLEALDFDLNGNVKGTIPSTLGLLPFLRLLDLNGTSLTGSLPEELCQASSLIRLDVRSNQLEGSIPTCLAGLDFLDVLALDSNNINGTLPTDVGQFEALRKYAFILISREDRLWTRWSNYIILQFCSFTQVF